ncbi:MAG: outer membrane protein assembly factor BamB [Betaproteobacteria bacterium RIFCSPLOWO2_02_FULL_66_14]|nr:MAG: outer membrane protein assembly factor BamB [Betaproteobacteria bacterium RIFCSPLOWO2_02_FULL_66_14]
MARKIAAAFVILALAGCSSAPSWNPLDWFASQPEGAKPAVLTPIAATRSVRALWTANVGSGDTFVFEPMLAGDSVYAAARDGTVVRIDAATGQVRWRANAGARLSAGVGADARVVVVATDEGEVIALEAQNGAPRWRTRVSSEVLARPVVGDDLVVVRSADSRVFAFNAADGKRRWVYQRAASSLSVRMPAGVTLHEGFVFGGFPGGKLIALTTNTGALRWEVTVALPKGATELERVTDVVGEPAMQRREVCVGAFQGRIACYEWQSGTQQWARDISTLTGVSIDAGHAYLSDQSGAVHAFDRSDGRSVWKQDRLANRRLTLPRPLGAEIAIGDLEGFVHFLSRDSGAFVARIATDGSPMRAAPIAIPGGLLVQTRNGGLFALGLQ